MKTSETKSAPFARAGFLSWLGGSAGGVLSRREQEEMNRILPELFGYHLAQVGCYPGQTLHEASRIGHKVVLRLEEDGPGNAGGAVAAAAALPFAAESIDVALAPHVLEFAPEPYGALKELERVLIPGGHLLVVGFNPCSFWGLRRLAPWRRANSPWNGRFHSAFRVRRWLGLLGLEPLETGRFLFRPPLEQAALMRRLLFLEKLGKLCWPFFGGTYVILARKRVAPLTPIKLPWRGLRKPIASGASADPATMTAPGDCAE